MMSPARAPTAARDTIAHALFLFSVFQKISVDFEHAGTDVNFGTIIIVSHCEVNDQEA